MMKRAARMRVLGIESSCDETGAAVVEDGRFMRSNVVATQAAIHERYGGVVPEVASRQQLSAISPVLESALEKAGVGWDDLDGIAVTYGPGLAGSLLVGLTAAKALALARGLPLLGVNHLEAHIYANWLRHGACRRGRMPCNRRIAANRRMPRTRLPAAGAGDFRRAQRAGVHIPRTDATSCLARRATTPPARRSTRSRASSVWAILVDQPSSGRPPPAMQVAPRTPTACRAPGSRHARLQLQRPQDGRAAGRRRGGAGRRVQGEGASRYARMGAELAAISVPKLAAAFQDAVVDVLAARRSAPHATCGVRQVVLAGGVAANVALRARLGRSRAAGHRPALSARRPLHRQCRHDRLRRLLPPAARRGRWVGSGCRAGSAASVYPDLLSRGELTPAGSTAAHGLDP